MADSGVSEFGSPFERFVEMIGEGGSALEKDGSLVTHRGPCAIRWEFVVPDSVRAYSLVAGAPASEGCLADALSLLGYFCSWKLRGVMPGLDSLGRPVMELTKRFPDRLLRGSSDPATTESFDVADIDESLEVVGELLEFKAGVEGVVANASRLVAGPVSLVSAGVLPLEDALSSMRDASGPNIREIVRAAELARLLGLSSPDDEKAVVRSFGPMFVPVDGQPEPLSLFLDEGGRSFSGELFGAFGHLRFHAFPGSDSVPAECDAVLSGSDNIHAAEGVAERMRAIARLSEEEDARRCGVHFADGELCYSETFPGTDLDAHELTRFCNAAIRFFSRHVVELTRAGEGN